MNGKDYKLMGAIGSALREKRTILGLTIAELAEELGMSVCNLGEVELGKRFPTAKQLYLAAHLFDVLIDELVPDPE